MNQISQFHQAFDDNNRFKHFRSLLIIFFISPVFALFISLKNGVNRYSRWMMYLMFFVFGYSLDTDPNTGADVTRIVNAFLHICEIRDHPNISFIDKITIDASKDLELGTGFIAFLVSFLTNNEHVFLGVLGFIYGVFYVEVLLFFIDLVLKKNQFYWSFVLSFAFIHTPFSFQAFRFYSGAIIFIWLFIQIFIKEKKNDFLNYFLLFIIGFLHNAHFVLVVIVLFRKLIPKSLILFFWLLYICFFIYSHFFGLDLGVFSEYLPEQFQDRTEIYSTEDKEDLTPAPELSWFLVYAYAINEWFFFLLNNLNYFLIYRMKRERELPDYIGFVTMLTSVSSLLLGTEGYRLHVIANQIMMLVFFYIHTDDFSRNLLKRLESKLRYVILFYVFILFRRTTDLISVYIFILNPLLFYALEHNYTITKLYWEIFK